MSYLVLKIYNEEGNYKRISIVFYLFLFYHYTSN